MSKSMRVKAGSYWRKLNNINRVFKAVEDHWSHTNGYFAYTKDGADYACYMCVDTDGLVRCRKDGHWYKSSPRQQLNRKYLSMAWQLKGSLAALRHIARQLPASGCIEDTIAGLEWQMKSAIEHARKYALDSDS